jgi:hypothetical protein
MGLATRTMPGVPRMKVGFIDHIEALRRKGGAELAGYEILHRHGA